MNGIEKIIKDVTLTYEQKVLSLARYAENSVRVLNISEDTEKLREEGIICESDGTFRDAGAAWRSGRM